MKLTPEQLKQNAAAMIAFADGKPIQFQNEKGEWDNCYTLGGIGLLPHRPKPEPKTRLWNCADDVPGPVCWIRPSGEEQEYMIHTVTKCKIAYGDYRMDFPIVGSWQYSTDRKTWHPCTAVE